MGLRFRKSIKIAKGVSINLGTKGVGLSFGTRGFRQSIHSSGRATTSIGLPGTGLSYVKSVQLSKLLKGAMALKGEAARRAGASNGSGESETKRAGNGTSPSGGAGQGKGGRLMDQAQGVPGGEFRMESPAHEAAAYLEVVEALKSLHKEGDEPVDWTRVAASEEPFAKGQIGPREMEAQKELEGYKPGIFGGLFNKEAGKRKEELQAAVDEAARRDQEDYDTWELLHSLAAQVKKGDVDAYLDVIAGVNPLEELVELGASFEYGTDDPAVLEVEYRVGGEDLIPREEVSLTATGRVSRKTLTKTAYYDLLQDHICSCVLRIGRDILALLPVDMVKVHVVEASINGATGYEEETTILSVALDRATMGRLRFEALDPSQAMENFPYNMQFQKTAGFKPVERL